MLRSAELAWLLAAVAKGDAAAFERLYATTRAKLYGVILRILRRADLADEVLEETYVQIWTDAAQFDPALSMPITWMVAIARHRAIDVLRRKPDLSAEDETASSEIAADSAPALDRRLMSEGLSRLLTCRGRLSEQQRRLILLAYYSGWSRDQLAEKFTASASTIKIWLRRALVEIRECLGP
jgi:RNA polymerase sigma-70 factor (ECF subfamily)